MYIIKNSLVSISRNKGRNLLIGIIVVVISFATAVTLAIRNSATSLITSYENQYEVTATIGINRENMRDKMKMDKDMSEADREEQRENMNNIFKSASSITLEDIEKYGNSNYVKDYYYQISVGVNSDDLEKAGNNESENSMGGGKRPGGRENFQNITASDFTLIGYSKLSAMEDFISGKYSITDGEISDNLEENNCIINSELAILNDIKVADKITFVDPTDEENKITLTVTGIFEEKSEISDSMGMFTSSANTIITNTTVVEDFAEENEDMNKSVTPTFILKDKTVIDSFSEELKKLGLSEYLSVSTNLEQVENATSTISNVNTFATTFLVITLVIGGVVLFVINMINIRERRYEIGVLRTIGMKKSLLTLQFICELLIVSFIALLIGAGLGAASSVSISNNLLENEISSSKEQRQSINENFGRPNRENMPGMKENFEKISGVADVQAFDSIDAVVNIKVLGQLLGLGIVLTLISSSASMISIQKFSPLTILKERS